jgi:hypothetical protein
MVISGTYGLLYLDVTCVGTTFIVLRKFRLCVLVDAENFCTYALYPNNHNFCSDYRI